MLQQCAAVRARRTELASLRVGILYWQRSCAPIPAVEYARLRATRSGRQRGANRAGGWG